MENFSAQRLEELVIPGTHHTSVTDLCQIQCLTNVTACQSLDVREQLNKGVRFLYFDVNDTYAE